MEAGSQSRRRDERVNVEVHKRTNGKGEMGNSCGKAGRGKIEKREEEG